MGQLLKIEYLTGGRPSLSCRGGTPWPAGWNFDIIRSLKPDSINGYLPAANFLACFAEKAARQEPGRLAFAAQLPDRDSRDYFQTRAMRWAAPRRLPFPRYAHLGVT